MIISQTPDGSTIERDPRGEDPLYYLRRPGGTESIAAVELDPDPHTMTGVLSKAKAKFFPLSNWQDGKIVPPEPLEETLRGIVPQTITAFILGLSRFITEEIIFDISQNENLITPQEIGIIDKELAAYGWTSVDAVHKNYLVWKKITDTNKRITSGWSGQFAHWLTHSSMIFSKKC